MSIKNLKSIDEKEYYIKLAEAKIKLYSLKNKIGYSKNGQMKMSEKKYKYIFENHRKMSNAELAKNIGCKITTLQQYLSDLYLSNLYLADDEILLGQLMELLKGRKSETWGVMIARKYGLKYRKDGYFNIISLNHFFDWYKKHPKIISIEKYKIGSLPAPDWFNEKAIADKRAFEYKYKRDWSESEDKTLEQMVKERKNYKEISFALKRTGSAIKKRCYDLKIQKPKRMPPVLWQQDEIEKLKELWLKNYEPCIIAEEINKSDRQIIAYLERFKYFGKPPEKFN